MPTLDSACVGCRRPHRMPPLHVVDGRVYCESCVQGLMRVLLAVVHHVQTPQRRSRPNP